MKHLLYFPFFLTILSCSNPKQPVDRRIVIGTVDSVYSEVLKEQRRFTISVPASSKDKTYGERRYPVLYVLDGDAHFHSVTGLLSHFTSNDQLPEMIVVGIPNTDRERDLTPSNSLFTPDGKTREWLKNTGGGENFTAFIEKELMPYVESHYPTAPYRVLIGHSFGGLFAVNALTHHPHLFNAYVAIDPSMWWDQQKLLKQIDSVFTKASFKGKILFVGVANTMVKNMDTLRVSRDTSRNSFHIRSIIQFARKVRSNQSNGLRFAWKYYENEDHGSVPLLSEYDGLRFIFDFYPPGRDVDTPEQFAEHFRSVSNAIGYPFPPPPGMMNGMGYGALEQKEYNRAFRFFELNLRNFPGSANAHDSMGDYYLATGDTLKAVELFEKAYNIEPGAETKKKLDRLRKK